MENIQTSGTVMAAVVCKQIEELPTSGSSGPSSIRLLFLWSCGWRYLGLLAVPCHNFPPPLHLLFPPPLHILFPPLLRLLLLLSSPFLLFPPLLEQKTGTDYSRVKRWCRFKFNFSQSSLPKLHLHNHLVQNACLKILSLCAWKIWILTPPGFVVNINIP